MTVSTVGHATQEALARLERLEEDLSRLREGPERAPLLDDVAALRETLKDLQDAEYEQRHRLGHDLRTPLNAIAGWTHILRMDAESPSTVARAADVLHRNVLALARVIDSHTTEIRH